MKFMIKKQQQQKTVFNVIEKLVKHDIHCLLCSYSNGVIDISSLQPFRHNNIKMTSSGRHSAKGPQYNI